MHTFLSLFLLFACDNPYEEAKALNTIEAYETYLKEHPTSAQALVAKHELESLYVEKAETSKSLEDYDAYLKRFEEKKDRPEHKKIEKQRMARARDIANLEDTPESYQRFIDTYKHTNSPKIKSAGILIKTAKYKANIEVSDLEQEQANMAQDAEGPLNGWLFSATITNNTTRDIKFLKAKLHFLDAEGNILSSHVSDGTVVIGELYGREWATPKPRKPPFKIGDSRKWTYLTGDIPPNWSKRVRLQLFQVQFMND